MCNRSVRPRHQWAGLVLLVILASGWIPASLLVPPPATAADLVAVPAPNGVPLPTPPPEDPPTGTSGNGNNCGDPDEIDCVIEWWLYVLFGRPQTASIERGGVLPTAGSRP